MKSGVILLNFGEPEEPTLESVVPFLERIFITNAALGGHASEKQARKRSRELAERRAPGLIEEYEEIGGSPLNRQAEGQAEALRAELGRRGHEVRTYIGMQFTEPSIASAVESARSDGVERLIGLPVYPLCGRSTTVAALETLARTVEELEWEVELRELSGWHPHPGYVALRADNIRSFAEGRGLDLREPGTRLVYSAHGTPTIYLKQTRYGQYVAESCAAISEALGVHDYVIGYQNHSNRPDVEWTQPEIEEVIRSIDSQHAVVVPISFMHEQSETLAELDIELKEVAEEVGIEFHRVPIPHDDPRFARILADLVEPCLDGGRHSRLTFGQCLCRPRPGTRCLNSTASEGIIRSVG